MRVFFTSLYIRPALLFSFSGNVEKAGGATSNPKCGDKYSVGRGEGLNIYCNPPMYGRNVYIRIPGNNKVIAMCEVEVYSDGKGKFIIWIKWIIGGMQLMQ